MVLSTAQSLFVPLHYTTINRLSNIITPFLIKPFTLRINNHLAIVHPLKQSNLGVDVQVAVGIFIGGQCI